MACGSAYAIALKNDGTVWSWGYNGYGALGNNSTTNSNVAIQVKDSSGRGKLIDICDISTTVRSCIALTNTGNVFGWGYNYQGQVGNGTKATSSVLPTKSSISDVVKIAGGRNNVLAIKADGTAWAWGLNQYGELGIGTASTSGSSSAYCKESPVQIKLNSTEALTNVTEIGTDYETSFAILGNGEVYGWGYNAYGNIGNNTTSNSSYPQKLKTQYGEEFTDKVVTLDKNTSGNVSFCIKEDGTVLGWGRRDADNGVRLLSNRTTTQATVTELSPDFITADKRAVYVKQGESTKLNVSVSKRLNALAGHIKIENLDWSSSDNSVAKVSNDGTITAVGLGECTITIKDTVNGYKTQSIVNVIQNNEKAITKPQISLGINFTVILKTDGSVWATGINTNGQLGDGTTVNRSKPIRVKINSKEYLSNIVKISAGEDHAIAVNSNGEVYAWGYNDYGQLGNGSTSRCVYATKVLNSDGDNTIKNIVDVSAGYKFSSVLTNDGYVYNFGRNAYGELGILNNTNKSLPTKMDTVFNAVNVETNSNGTIIQIGDGTVWSTGYNYYGTLGQNATNTGSGSSAGRYTPNPVINNARNGVLKDVIKIATGTNSVIALNDNNEAWVWGQNNVGQ